MTVAEEKLSARVRTSPITGLALYNRRRLPLGSEIGVAVTGEFSHTNPSGVLASGTTKHTNAEMKSLIIEWDREARQVTFMWMPIEQPGFY